MLSTVAGLYRQEIGAVEDVHRSLPFFGTALGIVIGALAYAAGRLPKWPDLATHSALIAFLTASVLLGLAIVEAACVLVWISLAIERRDHQRIGPEPRRRARLAELRAHYTNIGTSDIQLDLELLEDARQILIESYASTSPPIVLLISHATNIARERRPIL